MAKKKGSGGDTPATNRQRNIFVLRGTQEFKDWMDGLAAHAGWPVSVMVERALRELAKGEGYDVPPPRRVP
jgi:hypothetical protein